MPQYLLDTNVLLRGAVKSSAHNPAASGAIATLLARGDELLLIPQVLVEFWCVATRPTEVNGLGWPIDVVRKEIDSLADQFPVLQDTPEVFREWLDLVTRHRVIGKRVHDARLVALMNVHQIARLLTFNVGDFRGYGILAVSPNDVITSQ